MTHRGMEHRREAEADPGLRDAVGDTLGPQVDLDAESFEDVRRPTTRRRGSVPVLRYLRARPRAHERGRGRDVEGPAAVAAGPAGVEQIPLYLHTLRVGPHRSHEPRDLVGRLTLGAQGNDEPGYLRGRRRALHDLGHRGRRLVFGQVSPLEE